MSQKINLTQIVPEECAGKRLDATLAQLFLEFSRVKLQSFIHDGGVTVDGQQLRPKDKVKGGETIEICAKVEPQCEWQAEAIALSIVYEDDHLIIVNKPAGLVVHPAAGNFEGTMLNALLHHHPALRDIPRAGIVHRLDKDTSGILVVAKTLLAHTHLVKQLEKREFEREYFAVVRGVMTAGGTVDEPIDRHPTHRLKMAVVHGGRDAVTHYRVEKRYPAHTSIKVFLETGRTHQIRVHMAHIRYPIVGDQIYAGRAILPKDATPELREFLQRFHRQALHARRLGLNHPVTHEWMEWEAELPEDIQELLAVLERDKNDRDH